MKRIKTLFLSLVCILLCPTGSSLRAQMISTRPLEISKGPQNFSPSFIKQNKIKGITIVMVDKPDGEVIVDKGATHGYEFDSLGRVSRYYYTVLNNVTREEVDVPAIKRKGKIIRPATTKTVLNYVNDTIFTDLFYDSQGRVIGKRSRTGDYYDAWYYEYNDQGKLSKQLHCRETNASENRALFKLGVQTVLSSESFNYETLTSTQIKKNCLNDEGRTYKTVLINYDNDGNKLNEQTSFIISWMHSENYFSYDEHGRLLEKRSSSNESGNQQFRIQYEYDVAGNLIGEKRFSDNELQLEMNYLYDETKTFVRSEANRDHVHASIAIVKYGYTYY